MRIHHLSCGTFCPLGGRLMDGRSGGLHGRHGFIAERRYRPAQWSDPERWHRYSPQGEPWFGFQSVRELIGLPPEILLVPLIGHTAGHAGVAVRNGSGWLLHAGDAFFHGAEIAGGDRAAPPGPLAYERMMQVSGEDRLRNQERLRELARAHGAEVSILCSHDPGYLDAGSARREACTGDAHGLSSAA